MPRKTCLQNDVGLLCVEWVVTLLSYSLIHAMYIAVGVVVITNVVISNHEAKGITVVEDNALVKKSYMETCIYTF